MLAVCCLLSTQTTETTAAHGLSAILTIVDVEFAHTIRIASNMRCRVVVERVSHAPTLLRQHFLKRDTVFLNALVYSG